MFPPILWGIPGEEVGLGAWGWDLVDWKKIESQQSFWGIYRYISMYVYTHHIYILYIYINLCIYIYIYVLKLLSHLKIQRSRSGTSHCHPSTSVFSWCEQLMFWTLILWPAPAWNLLNLLDEIVYINDYSSPEAPLQWKWKQISQI